MSIIVAQAPKIDWANITLPEGRDKKSCQNMMDNEKRRLGLNKAAKTGNSSSGDVGGSSPVEGDDLTPVKKKAATPRKNRAAAEELDSDGNPKPKPPRKRKIKNEELDEDGNPKPKTKRGRPSKKAIAEAEAEAAAQQEASGQTKLELTKAAEDGSISAKGQLKGDSENETNMEDIVRYNGANGDMVLA